MARVANERLTSVNDTMSIVKICETLKDSNRDLADNIDIDGAVLAVDIVERSEDKGTDRSGERGESQSHTRRRARGRFQHRCDGDENKRVAPPDSPSVHVLHADADVWVGEEGAVEGNDVIRLAVMHDLELAQDLLPHRRFSVNQDKLQGGKESQT